MSSRQLPKKTRWHKLKSLPVAILENIELVFFRAFIIFLMRLFCDWHFSYVIILKGKYIFKKNNRSNISVCIVSTKDCSHFKLKVSAVYSVLNIIKDIKQLGKRYNEIMFHLYEYTFCVLSIGNFKQTP